MTSQPSRETPNEPRTRSARRGSAAGGTDAHTSRSLQRRVAFAAVTLAFALPLAPLLLVVASNAWVERSASAWSGYHVAQAAEVPQRPVAIVLGARVLPDGTVSGPLEDRLATALALYAAGRVEYILVSGDNGRRDYDEVNAMQAWLVARGVPVSAIYLDHAGFRTFDTMHRARRVFGVEAAIVCTQAYHVPRSVFLARRAGIDAIGVAADQRVYPLAHRDQRRERLARTKAVIDTLNPFARPRHLGDPIPVGVAAATLSHDHASVQPRSTPTRSGDGTPPDSSGDERP